MDKIVTPYWTPEAKNFPFAYALDMGLSSDGSITTNSLSQALKFDTKGQAEEWILRHGGIERWIITPHV